MAAIRMANSDTFTVTAPGDREIVLTRLFDAPRRLVFEAMTRPEHVKRWWGILDDGYGVPVCEIDLRVGGRWRFVGRNPRFDGPAFHGEYREVSPPHRLVYTEILEPHPDSEAAVVTVDFTEEAGKTLMTLTCLLPSVEVRDMVLKSGMERGAALSYDRLEELVVSMQQA